MRNSLPLLLGSALLLTACEDGPDKIFSPFEGDPKPQNGFQEDPDVFVPGDTKGYGDIAGGDNVGRAQFCDEGEVNSLIQEMVVQPIIPDVSVGGVPMWAPDGGPLFADDLLGPKSEGKFCNPTEVYLDAFTWGPTEEVIVFFDPETRLVDGVIGYTQYLGAMQGTFTDAGAEVPVVVQPRERLKIGGVELDKYASHAQAANEARSWLNPVNVTKLYRMVRQTFFGAEPFPEGFDCVAEQLCDLIYTGSNEAIPQDTFIVIQDSGIQIRFTPEGQAQFVYLQPVRSAPFENGGDIAFGAPGAPEMTFGFQSQLRENCALNLDDQLTWMDFQNRCIASGDERALERVNYNVDTARDAVSVEFNGVDLHFLRNTKNKPVLKDGEHPDPTDTLYSIAFSRTMPAPVEEFRPMTLGNMYKTRLEQRLKDSIIASGSTTAPDQHPFWNFSVDVPFTSDEPQRIGELLTDTGASWIPAVIAQIEDLYRTLTPEQKQMLDPRVLDHVYLIEPFVDSVLVAFSHGESEGPNAFKGFRTTDDARWSIGYSSFVRGGVEYRLDVQYSLNFGAVTYVEVSRGQSEIDRLISNGRGPSVIPYFQAAEMLGGTTVSLGSDVIQVSDFDRRLNTLTLRIDEQVGPDYLLEVPGYPLQDLNGYQRQIRGQRYEFVPAHEMDLFGKETILVIWIREDGTIGRVEDRLFKGALELCPGLPIRYGDDVRSKLLAWERTVSPNEYRDCDLTFNYSSNGNVLDSVASLSNRTDFLVVDGRAVTASVWE